MSGPLRQYEYVHPDEMEVRAISGGYEIEKEVLLEMDGRDVLCLVGNGVVDSSCCGVGGCRFAYVPGFIVGYRVRQNKRGEWISLVEPIEDPETRTRVRLALEETEMVQQVNFR